MRVEILNRETGEASAQELPPKLNPVWFGRHPKCHIVLPHSRIGPEAGAVSNDVSGGGGWRYWHRHEEPARVNGQELTARNQFALLHQRCAEIELPPFLLTVRFTEEEWASRETDWQRLNRSCADLVQQVHLDLLARHRNDSPDQRDWLRDVYVYGLEQEIAAFAAARKNFPILNGPPTELGDHLAGLAVRTAIVQRLTQGATAVSNDPTHWSTPRHVIPYMENALREMGTAVIRELQLLASRDLTEQVNTLDERFPSYWRTQVTSDQIAVAMRRYLAVRRLVDEVKAVWYGFGPLEELLKDPTITDIMVVSAEKIFIEKDRRTELSGRRFFTDPITIIQRIMSQAERPISMAQPLADARLPDGSRANAIIAPLSLTGPCLTIRKFPTQQKTAEELVHHYRSFTVAAKDFLRALVQNRRNLIVSGGTGTGKTTLLNALTGFIPPKERIVTIEDTAELRVQHEHVVSLQAKPKNLEGTGAIPIRDLVRNALRMRPDRIIVGECRGGEAIDMLQAMNTGHDGSMTTLHANNPEAAIARLVTLVQENADVRLPVEVIHRQIVSSIDIVIQLGEIEREGKVVRVMTEIAEITNLDTKDNEVQLKPIFQRSNNGELLPTGWLPTFIAELVRDQVLEDPVSLLHQDQEEVRPCRT